MSTNLPNKQAWMLELSLLGISIGNPFGGEWGFRVQDLRSQARGGIRNGVDILVRVAV